MKNLVIAALLGLVKIEAMRVSEYPQHTSTIQLRDEEDASQPEVIDDSDVVIQIYDKNEEDPATLVPPTASNDSDLYLQTKSELRFRPDPAQAPWAAAPAAAAKNDITGAFTVGESGSAGYTRVIPSKYDSTDKDDLLMRSVISTYAVEGRGDDGNPNGKFFVTKTDMNSLVDEVLANNMGFADARKKQAYADEHVPRLWEHFDMFGKGYLPVEEVPQFCRALLGEVEVSNSLQVQLDADINEKDMELHRPIDEVTLQFRPDPAKAPWAAKAVEETHNAIYKAFTPESNGHEYYERVVPGTWDSTDKDDLLMRSVILNYALEGRGDDGKPNGKFFLDQNALYKVGEEVVRTHIGYTGSKNKAYLDQYVPNIFKHFDVNG